MKVERDIKLLNCNYNDTSFSLGLVKGEPNEDRPVFTSEDVTCDVIGNISVRGANDFNSKLFCPSLANPLLCKYKTSLSSDPFLDQNQTVVKCVCHHHCAVRAIVTRMKLLCAILTSVSRLAWRLASCCLFNF